MSKITSSLPNMLLTLLVITLISGFLLGWVNQITIGPKAQVKAAMKIKALLYVLPEFNNDLLQNQIKIEEIHSHDSIEIFPAYQNGDLVGFALMGVSHKGYSGDVKCMVGYKSDGSIYKIKVVEQKETPGLGTKMKEERFIKQFIGKNPKTFSLKVKKDGGTVDALSGATISSRAFCGAVEHSYQNFETNQNLIPKHLNQKRTNDGK